MDKLDFSGPTRLDLRQEQIAELKQSGDYTWQEASNISAFLNITSGIMVYERLVFFMEFPIKLKS